MVAYSSLIAVLFGACNLCVEWKYVLVFWFRLPNQQQFLRGDAAGIDHLLRVRMDDNISDQREGIDLLPHWYITFYL